MTIHVSRFGISVKTFRREYEIRFQKPWPDAPNSQWVKHFGPLSVWTR